MDFAGNRDFKIFLAVKRCILAVAAMTENSSHRPPNK